MVKKATIAALLILLALCIAACNGISQSAESTASGDDPGSSTTQTQEQTTTTSSGEETTVDTTEQTGADTTEGSVAETTVATEPEHSPLYIEGLAVEDVIRYFNEVCLDAEFINGGDASLLQKWTAPIGYMLNGSATDEDLETLNGFVAWLNTIEGFPGMRQTQVLAEASMQIHFCTDSDMVSLLGENFTYMDAGVTFWYDRNEIYNAIVCYRTDLNQTVRNSVILEEIYNGLGPVQDTDLRQDSIIYSGYSEPQSLTQVDELLLKLLYHPQLQCGMNAAECEAVIRRLYY